MKTSEVLLSDPVVTSGIDWVSATFFGKVELSKLFPGTVSKTGGGSFGYDLAITYNTGMKILSSETRIDMGQHLILSGKCLSVLSSEYGVSNIDVLEIINREGGRISRIDLCIDAFNFALDINELSQLFKDGDIETSARTGHLITNIKSPGSTLYIGKRGSDKMIRIYDKAAQLSKSGDWKRIEIELRKGAAQSASEILLDAKHWHEEIPKIVNGFADFKSSLGWKMVTGFGYIAITPPDKMESATRKWLLKTCAPSIARLFMAGDNDIIRDVVGAALLLIESLTPPSSNGDSPD